MQSRISPVELPGNYLTTRKAASMLGISVRTVQQWVGSGKLQAWTTRGGHRRIAHSAVVRLLQERAQATSATPQAYVLGLLIVEDDLALIKLYQAHIATWPFPVRVCVTPNGYEALVLMGEMRPSLLICDLRLPGVNGFQIVRALAQMERFKHLRMVVISGLPQSEIAAHGGVPAGVDIMGKPIDFAKLRAIAQQQWEQGARELALA